MGLDMSGHVRPLRAVALLAAFGLTVVFAAPALAQDAGRKGYDRMSIPKPSERSFGTLEGDPIAPADRAAKAEQPKATAAKGKRGKKATESAAAAPADRSDDGGLPMPHTRNQGKEAPVGFDKNGNFSTGFKF